MRYIGILYSVFVCLTAGIVSLLVFHALVKKKREIKESYHLGLIYFCLMLGLLWISVGLGALFTYLGKVELRMIVHNILIGPLTYLHVLPIFYYFGWSFFPRNSKMKFLFDVVGTILVLTALFSHFKYGSERLELGYWGDNMVPHKITSQIFTFGVCLPAFLSIIVELIKRYRRWQKDKSLINKKLFGLSLGLLSYAVTGVLESQVFTEGWPLVMARVGVMIAPLILYFSFSIES